MPPTGGVGVAPANRVCPDESYHLAVAEPHAAKDVANVLNRSTDGALVRVRKAACGCRMVMQGTQRQRRRIAEPTSIIIHKQN